MDRSLTRRAGWLLRDYVRRVWDNSGEDNIFFLAGGIAFNLLLAAVPFVLLFATGLTYLSISLNQSPADASEKILELTYDLLPTGAGETRQAILKILHDIIQARGTVTLYGLIGFIWFSTRLFGSLRTVLAAIFDIETDRGIVAGKIFDVKITVFGSMLLALYAVLTTYLLAATTRGIVVLEQLGIRRDLMGPLQYTTGRALGFVFIVTMFFALYKFLPNRHIRWQTAGLASLFTSVLFEAARSVFSWYVQYFRPSSLYSGTVAVMVIVVVWVYYAAMIFILGGEVAQVYELRRMRRLQREAFED